MAYLAKLIAARGHEVVFFYGDGVGDPQTQLIDGVTCIDLMPTWRKPLSVAKFYAALKASKPDVLFSTLPHDFLPLLGIYARRNAGVYVHWVANDVHCSPWGSYSYNRWFHEPLYGLALSSAAGIAIQHERQRAMFSPRLRKRMAIVPNLMRCFGAKKREFDSANYDAIWIALIRPVKQLDVYLDLARALPNLRFAVVGGFAPGISSNDVTSFMNRIAGLANVEYLGPRRADEVIDLLAQSKILVNTSSSEGFPITMLEAWSVGLPVVSLTVDPGGIIVQKGLGAISKTSDRMAIDVADIATSKSRNEELGDNGFQYVRRHHSAQAVYDPLMQLIGNIGNGKHGVN